MNKRMLDKMPKWAHQHIINAWKGVYIYQTLNRDTIRATVDGILLGVYYSDYLTSEECEKVRQYYRKWFSL